MNARRAGIQAAGHHEDDQTDQALGDPPHNVTCTRCGATFDGFGPSQAIGCASELVTQAEDGSRDITGFYGSCVADMEVFAVARPELLAGIADGVICDACITSLEAAGVLAEPEKTDMFGQKLSAAPDRSPSTTLDPEMAEWLAGLLARRSG